MRTLCALVAPLIASCSLSVGLMTSAARSEPHSYHTGFTAQSMVHLPQSYRYSLGLETSTLFQTSPGIESDQWRLGFVGGYSSAPRAKESWGFELLGRAQYLRGAEGNWNANGFVFGTSVAFPWRWSVSLDPLEGDDFPGLRIYIVPALGINGVIATRQTVHPEIFFNLSVRLAGTSLLLP